MSDTERPIDLDEYVQLSAADSNLWWKLSRSDGHHLLDESLERLEAQQAEIERLRDQLQAGPPVCQECDAMRAEIERLRDEILPQRDLLDTRWRVIRDQQEEIWRLCDLLAEIDPLRALLREAVQDLERVTMLDGTRCWEIVVTDEWMKAARAAGGKDE